MKVPAHNISLPYTANRYKYSGKEFETRGGLNSYDFHARQYAPALPLFDTTDPKAWDYPGYNPYLYCAANPIMLKTGVNEEDTEAAIEIITKSIENRVPLMAGVDSMPGKNINEGTTDHFLTIVGIGNDEKCNFVQVFENATGSEIFGTSTENKLYYNPESKTFTGQTRLKPNRMSPLYTISQIRISYPKK